MKLFRTVAAAFSMFSKIPMPRIEWKDDTLRYMLCAFPLVGAAIGLIIWGWCALCAWLRFPQLVFAAGITLIPVAVTGGIHLDGFMDTSDALASHAEPQRMREILKDPRTGAFAVIGLCSYMLAYTATASGLEPNWHTALMLGLMHIFSRALSGLCALLFPVSGQTGTLSNFRELADRWGAVALLIIEAVLAAAGPIMFSPLRGAVMAAAGVACAVWLYFMAKKRFGGMSGDLSGWFLQVAELLMLAVYFVFERIGGL